MSPEMRELMRYIAREDKILKRNSYRKVLLTLANLPEEEKNSQAERIVY